MLVKNGHVGLKILLMISGCIGLIACSSDQHNVQGYIEGDLTYMASSQPGRLINLDVKKGESVQAGQVLFTLEPEPRNFALENAKASLEQAKDDLADLIAPQKRPTEQASIQAQIDSAVADVSYTQLQLTRNKKLVQVDAVQQQALDQAIDQADEALANLKNLQSQLATAELSARINQIKAAEAQVLEAQSSLDQAAWMLNQTIVRAPEGGFVFDNFYWPGEEIPMNTAVLSLLSPDHIKVIFYVPETDLAGIKLGSLIKFKTDGISRTGQAKIAYISPNAEYTPPVIYSRDRQDQLVYRVEALFDNPKDAITWHPGQPVTVSLS